MSSALLTCPMVTVERVLSCPRERLIRMTVSGSIPVGHPIVPPTGLELALSANCGRLDSLAACRIADVGSGDHAMLQVVTLFGPFNDNENTAHTSFSGVSDSAAVRRACRAAPHLQVRWDRIRPRRRRYSHANSDHTLLHAVPRKLRRALVQLGRALLVSDPLDQ